MTRDMLLPKCLLFALLMISLLPQRAIAEDLATLNPIEELSPEIERIICADARFLKKAGIEASRCQELADAERQECLAITKPLASTMPKEADEQADAEYVERIQMLSLLYGMCIRSSVLMSD